MAKKIIRLSRTKEQKQANRERNERANRTILSRTLILMILCGVIAFCSADRNALSPHDHRA